MLLATIAKVFYRQFFITPPAPDFNCSGKTFIVTGANSGLGKEAARHFVDSGAKKVILACRSVARGEEARKDIETSTQRDDVVEVWLLDLMSNESVRAFAERVRKLDRVDALVENAGINTQSFSLVEGNESSITVNVISMFLLALLVLPHLQASASRHGITPTVTLVNSEVHGFTSFPERKALSIFEALNDRKTARMIDRYNVSKLVGLLACQEMTRGNPISQTKVTFNLVNPGLCQSELMREMDSAAVSIFQKIFARTAEVGSRTLVHAAMQGPPSHGQYFSDCRLTECDGFARSKEAPEVQKKLWQELVKKLDIISPGITRHLAVAGSETHSSQSHKL